MSRRQVLTAATASPLLAACTREPPKRAAVDDTTATLRDRVEWGAYASPEPFPDCGPHFDLEEVVGRRLTMSWFSTWGLAWPDQGGREAAEQQRDIHFAWQPRLAGGEPARFYDIIAGRHDDYITRFFDAVATHPGQVTIRFAHEMNARSYPWSFGYEGERSVDSPAEYVAAWQYVVQAQRDSAADNVDWAWCISAADRDEVSAEDCYPGNDIVDVLAMDIYVGYGGNWQSAAGSLRRGYERLTALSDTAPVWVTELGCREPSKVENAGVPVDPDHDKADWYRELFAITDYPRLSAIDFFHAEKEHDWRLDSTREVLQVVHDALGN